MKGMYQDVCDQHMQYLTRKLARSMAEKNEIEKQRALNSIHRHYNTTTAAGSCVTYPNGRQSA